MGLDITYYRRLTPVSAEEQAEIAAAPEPRDLAYERNLFQPYDNTSFPGRVDGVDPAMASAQAATAVTDGGAGSWRSSRASRTSTRGGLRRPTFRSAN